MGKIYRRRKLLVIECTPKRQKKNEGLILYEFLRMTTPRFLPYQPRVKSSKQALITYLKSSALRKFGYVHLSGHGYGEECVFCTPNGDLRPEDFPVNCFANKMVTLSACSLGGKDFMNPFMDRTSAKYVLAPRKDVDYVDAALWYVTFYYHVLHKGVKPDKAYDLAKEELKKIEGDFKFWYWKQ